MHPHGLCEQWFSGALYEAIRSRVIKYHKEKREGDLRVGATWRRNDLVGRGDWAGSSLSCSFHDNLQSIRFDHVQTDGCRIAAGMDAFLDESQSQVLPWHWRRHQEGVSE